MVFVARSKADSGIVFGRILAPFWGHFWTPKSIILGSIFGPPHKTALGAVLDRLRSLPRGLGEIDPRSAGGRGGNFRWPWPLGSATIKDYLVRNNNQHQVIGDLNTPWARGPANYCWCSFGSVLGSQNETKIVTKMRRASGPERVQILYKLVLVVVSY